MILRTFMRWVRTAGPALISGVLFLGGTSGASAQTMDLNLLTDAALKACVQAEAAELGWTNTDQVEFLSCYGMGIVSTAGLSQFTSLRSLGLGDNGITMIDLSPFPQMEYLNISSNQLTAIDVSAASRLIGLGVDNNLLTSLNVDSNPALETLTASHNRLSTIHLRNNTALSFVVLNNNQLSELDLSQNAALENLGVGFNRLTALDISNNPKLTFLNADVNRLTELDTSNNPVLDHLGLQSNQIRMLDISGNTRLQYVRVSGNPLSVETIQALQARNGTGGLVVDLDGQVISASFPGGISGSLGGSIGDTSVLFSVNASGTYNFRFNGSVPADATAPIVFLEILDDVGNRTGPGSIVASPESISLQAQLEAGHSYVLRIRHVGLLQSSMNYSLNVTRAELHTISGRIIDVDGKPVQGLAVGVVTDSILLGRGVTNKYGVYTITAFGSAGATVFIADQFERNPRYAYAGNSAGMAPGTYDASLSGYVTGTDLDFSTRDLRNINMQIAGAAIEGELDRGAADLGTADFLQLVLRAANFDGGEYVDLELNAGGGSTDFGPVSLVPDTRYEVRARLISANGAVEEYRKVFPSFLRTDAHGKLGTYNLSLPAGSFEFDPSLSSSWSIANSTASLREDGSFASSTLISPDRSFFDSLGEESGSASTTSTDAEDYYVFQVEAQAPYEFAVDVAVPGAALQLELFDAGQNRLFVETGDLSAGASPALTRTLIPGTYFLRVSAVSGSSAYTLHLEPSTRNVQLAPAFFTSNADNVSLDHEVNPVDYYRFRAAATGLHHFRALYDPALLQLKLVLRDASNAVINVGAIDMLSHNLVAGTDYILEVRAESGAGDYQLGIEPESARGSAGPLPRGIVLPR